MADEQIIATCTWTNGDATVECSGTTFLTDLAANDVAKPDVSGQPPYTVGSVTDDTHFELTSTFAGTTGSYSTVIQRSFTANLHLDRPASGDHGWGELLASVIDKIDTFLSYVINSAYDSIRRLNPAPATDHSWNGDYIVGTAGEDLVFGNLVYLKSDGKYWKANATAVATMPGVCMAVATISADATGNLLQRGYARDDSWAWSASGVRLYAGETAGAITETQPSDSGDQVQAVGHAVDDDNIFFCPVDVVVEV